MNPIQDFTLEDIYFKDAFTKEEDNLNLEVNNISVDCITSKNNNFSLDQEGNLIVNSISANTCDLMYPVGSIYLSVNSTNPSTLFGGSWEQIKDCFLLACGDTYSSNTTGGEATHTLTTNEIPKHTHGNKSLVGRFSGRRMGTSAPGVDIVGIAVSGQDAGICSKDSVVWSGSHTMTSAGGSISNPKADIVKIDASHEHTAVGSGQAHNNMPPYLAVYAWQRII